uniref:Galanin-like peptide n=2 Tax=Lygus hesperus TaxID=30085 RepID=A0A0A9YEN3_LYGHE
MVCDRMLVLQLVVLLSMARSGVTDDQCAREGCQEWNKYTDYYVKYSNQLSMTNDSIQIMDIDVDLPLLLGLPLSMSAKQGRMGVRSTLTRRFNSCKCSTVCNQTLSSFFQYDNLVLTYDKVEARYLYFIRMESNLVMRINANSFRFAITKTCTSCYLNSLEVQDFQDYDIEIESSYWWNRWFMRPILGYGLEHYNKAFISNIINDQVSELFAPFISTYCTFD